MRALILFFVVLVGGMFLGHEFWPKSHSDPGFHFRFHRGKMPHIAEEKSEETKQKFVKKHGRVFPQTQEKPGAVAFPSPAPKQLQEKPNNKTATEK